MRTYLKKGYNNLNPFFFQCLSKEKMASIFSSLAMTRLMQSGREMFLLVWVFINPKPLARNRSPLIMWMLGSLII